MTKSELKKDFENDLRATLVELEKIGIGTTKFKKMLDDLGGYATATELLHSNNNSGGLLDLQKMKRKDLTIEYFVTLEKYQPLFEDKDIEEAKWRLDSFGNNHSVEKLCFKSKIQEDKLKYIFEELGEFNIVDIDQYSIVEMADLLTCDNVFFNSNKIYFTVELDVVSYIFETYLYKLFYNLNNQTVEDSKRFIQFRKYKGEKTHIKNQALRNVKGREIPEEIKKIIDTIFIPYNSVQI